MTSKRIEVLRFRYSSISWMKTADYREHLLVAAGDVNELLDTLRAAQADRIALRRLEYAGEELTRDHESACTCQDCVETAALKQAAAAEAKLAAVRAWATEDLSAGDDDPQETLENCQKEILEILEVCTTCWGGGWLGGAGGETEAPRCPVCLEPSPILGKETK